MDGFLYNMAFPLCEPGVQQHLTERKRCTMKRQKLEKPQQPCMIHIGNTGWSTLMNVAAVTCYCTCASDIFSF